MGLTDKQFLILLGVGAVGLYLVGRKVGDAVNAVNPFNNENAIYTNTREAVGGDTFDSVADHLFSVGVLIAPWADDTEKAYARQVWGLDDATN